MASPTTNLLGQADLSSGPPGAADAEQQLTR